MAKTGPGGIETKLTMAPPKETSSFVKKIYEKAQKPSAKSGGQIANFGLWYPPEGVKPQPHMRIGEIAVPDIMARDEKKDTALWPYLFQLVPGWMWGNQGTGDCVSWGWKHMLDILMIIEILLRGKPEMFKALIRQEAAYAFARVEINGRPDYGGPGTYSAAAFKGAKQFGTLHELDYSDRGGLDLRKYSGQRARTWGRTGVPDHMEPIAKEHRVKEGVTVTSSEMAGALIQNGYPLTYCGHTYWGRTRNSDGIATRHSSGAHCMTITGVRYKNDRPWCFFVANTGHGNHCSGPKGPIDMPDVYAQQGAWVENRRIEPVLRRGDCHSVSVYEGFKARELPDIGSHIFG